MKRDVTKLAAAALLALSLCACGASGGSAQQATDAQPAEEAPAATDEAAEPELQSEEFKDVILVDNDIVTITLEKFYQKNTNWARSSGTFEPTTTNEVAVKIKDKTEYGSSVDTEAYLNDEKLYCARSGNSMVDAGKTVNISYTIGKDTQPDWSDLDSFDDLYNVSLAFEIMRKNADGVYLAGSDAIEVEVNLGKAINGEIAPVAEDDEGAASAAVTVEDIEAALEGTWALDDKGTFTFGNGEVFMGTNQGGLSGTYEINLDASYIIGKLQATDGDVDFGVRFTYDDQTLRLFNNEGVELTKL